MSVKILFQINSHVYLFGTETEENNFVGNRGRNSEHTIHYHYTLGDETGNS